MLRKSYSKKGNSCWVTFDLPPEVNASTVSLCGEFNEWDASAQQMKRGKQGGFSTRISLPSGQTYRFRYLLDGQRWENDWAADGYVPNSFGTEDSLLKV